MAKKYYEVLAKCLRSKLTSQVFRKAYEEL